MSTKKEGFIKIVNAWCFRGYVWFKREIVKVSSAKTTIPTVEWKVIGFIDWDGFLNDFMKEIHTIEIKPKG